MPRPGPLRRRRRPDLAAGSLAGPLIAMGTLHWLVPSPFDAIIPSWVPGRPRFWTLASGVAEIAIGTAIAVPATRRAGAAAAAGLFVAVFPANVQMALDWRAKPWPYQVVAWARLPLQYPMITHALRVRRSAA